METKDLIYELRTKRGLSQEELAEKVFVTRQAVKTRPFHGCNMGSIPVRVTNEKRGHRIKGVLFFRWCVVPHSAQDKNALRFYPMGSHTPRRARRARS